MSKREVPSKAERINRHQSADVTKRNATAAPHQSNDAETSRQSLDSTGIMRITECVSLNVTYVVRRRVDASEQLAIGEG